MRKPISVSTPINTWRVKNTTPKHICTTKYLGSHEVKNTWNRAGEWGVYWIIFSQWKTWFHRKHFWDLYICRVAVGLELCFPDIEFSGSWRCLMGRLHSAAGEAPAQSVVAGGDEMCRYFKSDVGHCLWSLNFPEITLLPALSSSTTTHTVTHAAPWPVLHQYSV